MFCGFVEVEVEVKVGKIAEDDCATRKKRANERTKQACSDFSRQFDWFGSSCVVLSFWAQILWLCRDLLEYSLAQKWKNRVVLISATSGEEQTLSFRSDWTRVHNPPVLQKVWSNIRVGRSSRIFLRHVATSLGLVTVSRAFCSKTWWCWNSLTPVCGC